MLESTQTVYRPCLSCGWKNDPTAVACAGCGQTLQATVGRTSLELPTAYDRFLDLARAWRKPLLWSAGALAVLLVALIIVALGFRDETQGPETSRAALPGAPMGPGPAENRAEPTEGEGGLAADGGAPAGLDARTAEDADGEDSPEAFGAPPPPTGLAVPVGDAVREAGFDIQLLRAFATRAQGPEDAVLLSVHEMDRDRIQQLLDVLSEQFEALGHGDDLPTLGRISLISTDTEDVVHKHELQRGDVLRARQSPEATEQFRSRLGLDSYPGSGPDEVPEDTPLAAVEEPAAESGSEDAEPVALEELGYRPMRADPKVLHMLARSRFPDLQIELKDEEIVVRGPAEILPTVALYLKQVDKRPEGGRP